MNIEVSPFRGLCRLHSSTRAEKYSNLLDWSDRSTCVLFGDGAGAVVLSAKPEEGIISSHIHADGQYNDLLDVKKARQRFFLSKMLR